MIPPSSLPFQNEEVIDQCREEGPHLKCEWCFLTSWEFHKAPRCINVRVEKR